MTDINIQVDDEVSTTTQQESTPMVTVVDSSKRKRAFKTRPKRNVTDTVRALLRKGYSAKQIQEVSGVSKDSIYNIKWYMKRKEKLKQKPLQFIAATTATKKPVIVKPDAVQVGGDHYKDHKIQVWDAIHDWGLGYFSGNVIKYVARHQKKNGIEDLKKARHYLDKLIAMAEKQAKGE